MLQSGPTQNSAFLSSPHLGFQPLVTIRELKERALPSVLCHHVSCGARRGGDQALMHPQGGRTLEEATPPGCCSHGFWAPGTPGREGYWLPLGRVPAHMGTVRRAFPGGQGRGGFSVFADKGKCGPGWDSRSNFRLDRKAGPLQKCPSGASVSPWSLLLTHRWCVWAGRGDMGPDMELPSHSKQLLLQLNQQRTQGFLCDVIVMVENAVFRAHKNVLAASSVYFKSLVLHDNLISLDTDMVSSAVFQQILDFIYTGRLLPGEPPAEPNFSTLLTAASYLQLPELAALCRRKLKRAGKPFGSGRGGTGLGRHPRSQRLSTASVIQTRYPGLVDGRKGAHAPQELSQAKGSDDELFLGGLSQEGAHGLGRPVCPGSGEAGLGGCSTNGAGGSCEQELGLDLSKKSPPLPPATPGPSLTPDDPAQLSDSQEGSPLSTSAPPVANSASYTELGGALSEPMDLEGADDNPLCLLEGPGGPPPRKSLRHSARKKEWAKKEPAAASPFERRDVAPKGPCPGEEAEGLESDTILEPAVPHRLG
ncbi:hypothetical protein E5288_WYG019141 [Bos mutus]|uniref:BTB domain-containing protein n=1 Tax=Bos mutus TaxID=72004 RepID=A0A6B0S7M6_9CETA|nr:hypothetical protein [Bos mutus]